MRRLLEIARESVLDQELSFSVKLVSVKRGRLCVDFRDGRTLLVPLSWYPRLKHATPAELRRCEADSIAIEWPELDDGVSIKSLLLGRKAYESPRWVRWWLAQRRKGKAATFIDYMEHRRARAGGTKRKTNRTTRIGTPRGKNL